MKDNKIIKDLKERNDKLKMQYDFNNIHLISLENKYANLQTENTKLKQYNQELTRIVEALEMAKQNMPKGTQFVIVAEEDYLRNIGIINERETNE